MAPVIQPKTLFNLCIDFVSRQVDQACTSLFLEHGCFGNEDALNSIREIQNHLVSQLPNTVFERLSDDRNSQTQSHLWSKDAGVKLAVFLHPVLTRFSVDNKGNELLQSHDDGLDEFFWSAQIRNMTNLTHLNLNLITTDEILIIVGSSCPKLEVVNIVSRIKQDINNDRHLYPGITLKFCVSDLGLRSLLKCKRLRRITMNKIINNHHSAISYHGISLSGVKALIFGLPKLEFINFGSIGKVLFLDGDQLNSEEAHHRELKLNYYSELDPNFVNVSNIQKFCPHICHISLSVPISVNSSGAISTNVTKCTEILRALSESSLPLRIIELQHFPYGEMFKQLLRNKGSRIDEILFRANGQLTSEHIRFIGETCPRLQKLHLKEVGFEDKFGYIQSNVTRLGLFKELTSIHISGRMWNPMIILPLLLSNASKIQQIGLLNMMYRIPMDSAILKLMQFNKLNELSSMTLYSGCFLSMNLIRQLVFECKKLTLFSFLQFEGFDIPDVDALKQEVESLNLDIKLQCLELIDS